ncbi:hypothetical protein BTO04_03330 [Polaribacter sp. SA4-10]|nr:hypothetical protein BTO04_03330 [Polaribacter sp. SA4-10]
MLMRSVFTPIESRPKWTQIITVFNPIRNFIEVMRMVLLHRADFKNRPPQQLKTLLDAIVISSYKTNVGMKKAQP